MEKQGTVREAGSDAAEKKRLMSMLATGQGNMIGMEERAGISRLVRGAIERGQEIAESLIALQRL